MLIPTHFWKVVKIPELCSRWTEKISHPNATLDRTRYQAQLLVTLSFPLLKIKLHPKTISELNTYLSLLGQNDSGSLDVESKCSLPSTEIDNIIIKTCSFQGHINSNIQ